MRKIQLKQKDGTIKEVKFPAPEQVEILRAQLKTPTCKFPGNEVKEIELIRETREYELITPLFGGGAETKKADEISVVRTTEIRGHLRFWWRASRGARFRRIEELRKHEDAIFGSTEQSSALQVEVTGWSKIGEDSPFEVVLGKPNSRGVSKPKVQPVESSVVPPYSAFPLQPKVENLKVGMITEAVTTGAKFKISVSYPETFTVIKVVNGKTEIEKEFLAADEIRTAFWAWETFGGIGARTRRGFGAINLTKVNGTAIILPKAYELKSIIEKNLSEVTVADNFSSLNIPHLSNHSVFALTRKSENAEKSWKLLIDKLKRFRQYRKDKETKRESPFGKSQWTEPDALRYRMEKRDFPPSIDKFPRAAFGLPILFHMPQPFDNFETTLKGRGDKEGEFIDRLSSPLILRPVKCIDGTIGVGLILNTPRLPPNGLTLTDVFITDEVLSNLDEDEAKRLTLNLELLNNETDVLKAFLKYLEK